MYTTLIDDVCAAMVPRLLRALDGGDDAGGKSSGPPARWQEWLDKTQQGGKKRVQNPNAKTKSSHPDVAFTTGLKDKTFMQKAMKEYYEWIKKNPEKSSKPKEETKEEPKPKPEAPKSNAKSPFKMDKKRIDTIIEKHGAKFKELISSNLSDKDLDDALSKHQDRYGDAGAASKLMSRNEKLLHLHGKKVGDYIQSQYSENVRESQDYYMSGWRNSSGSRGAQNLYGFLEAQGIKGHRTPGEVDSDQVTSNRKSGVGGKDLKEYFEEIQHYQQAFFQHLGIKELTLFRGVRGQGTEDLKDHDTVQLESRELSSFSLNPKVADGFAEGGGKMFAVKVPVELIFESPLTRPQIGVGGGTLDESEIVVMGASELELTVTKVPS